MNDDFAYQMQEVFLSGLRLRDRVADGARPDLRTEQSRLRGLLGAASLPPPWGPGAAGALDRSIDGDPHAGREFLGIRYALTCWLDEIMIDAGWREWEEDRLEQSLYRISLRYQNFWDQYQLAETATAPRTQEAFLLCVLLGFRGAMGAQPDELKKWVKATRSRVTRWLGQELPALPERAPVTDVPPLLGVEKYRVMTRWVVGGVLGAVLVTAFLGVVLLR